MPKSPQIGLWIVPAILQVGHGGGAANGNHEIAAAGRHPDSGPLGLGEHTAGGTGGHRGTSGLLPEEKMPASTLDLYGLRC